MSNTKEIRILVDRDFITRISKRIGATTNVEVLRVAFTILEWASKEIKGKRIILSSDTNGNRVNRLAMPELEQARVTA